MFRSLVTLVLSGCLVQPGFADDCSCTAYTTDAATDANCAKLKEYISCTFKADDGTPCTVPVADRTAIAAKKCTPEQPKDTCKCEIDYYGKELGASTICGELKTLDECLEKATEQTGCGDETLDGLKAFSKKTKNAKACPTTPVPVSCTAEGVCQHGGTCPTVGANKDVLPCDCPKEYEGPKCEKKKNAATTPAPVDCKTEGVCQHGGTCPTDGDHKDKTPCDCPKEYEGPKCEKKKNAGTMVSPKDVLILTTFISCLIMLFA